MDTFCVDEFPLGWGKCNRGKIKRINIIQTGVNYKYCKRRTDYLEQIKVDKMAQLQYVSKKERNKNMP